MPKCRAASSEALTARPGDVAEADHRGEGDVSAPAVEIDKEIIGTDVALHQAKQVMRQALGHGAAGVAGEHASQVEPIHLGWRGPRPCGVGKRVGDGNGEKRSPHGRRVESGEDLPHGRHPFILVAVDTSDHQQGWSGCSPDRHEGPQHERLAQIGQ